MGADVIAPKTQSKTYSSLYEVFREAFPIYLVYGMTAEQFWDDDPCYTQDYKRAFEYRRELENETLWLQGLYFRDAVANALNGRKSKYPDAPYPLKTEISKKRKEAEQEQNERKVIDYMMTFTEQFNKRFAEKKQQSNQNNGSV